MQIRSGTGTLCLAQFQLASVSGLPTPAQTPADNPSVPVQEDLGNKPLKAMELELPGTVSEKPRSHPSYPIAISNYQLLRNICKRIQVDVHEKNRREYKQSVVT